MSKRVSAISKTYMNTKNMNEKDNNKKRTKKDIDIFQEMLDEAVTENNQDEADDFYSAGCMYDILMLKEALTQIKDVRSI